VKVEEKKMIILAEVEEEAFANFLSGFKTKVTAKYWEALGPGRLKRNHSIEILLLDNNSLGVYLKFKNWNPIIFMDVERLLNEKEVGLKKVIGNVEVLVGRFTSGSYNEQLFPNLDPSFPKNKQNIERKRKFRGTK